MKNVSDAQPTAERRKRSVNSKFGRVLRTNRPQGARLTRLYLHTKGWDITETLS